MTYARYDTAKNIINRVRAECGLDALDDPFAAGDDATGPQMSQLLSTCGEELIKLHGWQQFQREHVIVTDSADTGKYPLPEDFDHMIDQTGWSRTQRVRLPGSLGPDIWQYLRGRNLVSSTIYMVFRNVQGEFWVYPQPPDAAVPAGLTLAFEYAARGWVQDDSGASTVFRDEVTQSGDVVLFDRILIQRLLKLRFREARGLDTTGAMAEFLQMFDATQSQDRAAYAVNCAGITQPFPYLDMWRNTPDTGYGMSV